MRFKLVNFLSGRTAARRQDELGIPRAPDIFTQLSQYVGKSPGGDLPYFMHVTKTDKIGVNPKQHYLSTPLGVYFYPVTAQTVEQLRRSSMYRMDAQNNIFVVAARNPYRVLVLTENSSGIKLYRELRQKALDSVQSGQNDTANYEKPQAEYSVRELNDAKSDVKVIPKHELRIADPLMRALSDASLLSKGVSNYIWSVDSIQDIQDPLGSGKKSFVDFVDMLFEQASGWMPPETREVLKRATPEDIFDAIQRLKTKDFQMERVPIKPVHRNILNFTTALMKQGYEGVYDPGLGVIHKNEPAQAVFFGSRYYTVALQGVLPIEHSFARSHYSGLPRSLLQGLIHPKSNSDYFKNLAALLDSWNDTESADRVLRIASLIPDSYPEKIEPSKARKLILDNPSAKWLWCIDPVALGALARQQEDTGTVIAEKTRREFYAEKLADASAFASDLAQSLSGLLQTRFMLDRFTPEHSLSSHLLNLRDNILDAMNALLVLSSRVRQSGRL